VSSRGVLSINMAVEPLAMCYAGRLTPRFRTIQVCPKDLRAALRQVELWKTERTGQSAALIAHRGGSPHARPKAA
jgi:hypothetical protein